MATKPDFLWNPLRSACLGEFGLRCRSSYPAFCPSSSFWIDCWVTNLQPFSETLHPTEQISVAQADDGWPEEYGDDGDLSHTARSPG
jgi:hypothetical protein